MEALVERPVVCPSCGQVRVISCDPNKDASSDALHRCTCDGAIRWRAIQCAEIEAEEYLGEGFREAGFSRPLPIETVELVKRIIPSVYDGHAKNVTFISCASKVTIKYVNRTKVDVCREEKIKAGGGGRMS